MLSQNARLDVRRLAALDMHGTRGTLRRRRVILAEFGLGVVGAAVLGIWLLIRGGTVGIVFGVWLLGLAANYLPLTVHVLALWRSEALQAELEGIDLRGQFSYYTRAQVWVLVPFWIAGLAILQTRRRVARNTADGQ